MTLEEWLRAQKTRVEACLDTHLPRPDVGPENLHAAMRYSALEGGKRFRAALIYATGEALRSPDEALDTLATAVELIHAYSLIHDDLPAMDDDALRRGRPTLHVAYDEATAILAGDALQALAFEILARPLPQVSPGAQLLACGQIAAAIGSLGMAGGQAMDLEAEGRAVGQSSLEGIHRRKTGRLIEASVVSVAQLSQIEPAAMEALGHYARRLGLAYQVQDDILDETADTQTLGKTAGADLSRQKSTYPACLGLQQSQALAADLAREACAALPDTAGTQLRLRQLADWVVQRRH